MQTKRVVLIVGMIGMLMAPLKASSAYALDYCFYGFLEGPIVVPRFRPPSKGTCKVYGAYYPTSVDVVTMTICTNTAGTALRAGFSQHPGSLGGGDTGGCFVDGQMNIPLPLGIGPGGHTYRAICPFGEIVTGLDLSVTATPCPPGQQLP